MSRRELLKDIRKHLEYHKSIGNDYLPKDMAMPKTSKNTSTLDQIKNELAGCTRCRLHKGRNNIVMGQGNPNASLMFVGEGPGRDEDIQGLAFVGRAGKLLTKIIEAMGFTREEVFIGNVVKCRPPENRNPENDEIATCIPFLDKQIAAIKPKVIVCLGTFAAQTLLNTDEKISHLRGKCLDRDGVTIVPTYHPAFCLRNPNMKKPVWEDMKKVMEILGKEVKS
jgi:uracil-DNA glycosylase family 4